MSHGKAVPTELKSLINRASSSFKLAFFADPAMISSYAELEWHSSIGRYLLVNSYVYLAYSIATRLSSKCAREGC
ncbi:hypothetical protein P8C59_007067 [Phyllachora maydis]|uniref:Uncharacterized protein n=1 Tax=Phyllachora maydis TaxID=1825666 RepID=A0AAD9I8T7_9PEZI|nr:hypothetical protein P8C59_007067 [Phyllachora maydis]